MGIVKTQSIQYTLLYYFGVGLGYLNTVILFPKILDPDEFGLTRILLSVSIVIAQLAQLGSTSMVIRYHAILREKVFSLGVLICSFGLIILLGIAYFFKNYITSFYIENSQLFVSHYLLLIPFTIAIAYFNLFDSYLRAIYRNIFSAFLSNIILRIIWLGLIIIYSQHLLDFNAFIILYSSSYAIISMISLIYITLFKQTTISFKFHPKEQSLFRQIFNFNTFTLLAGLSIFLINKVDIIMLGSMENLATLGIYAIASYMAMVIRVPASSIGRTAQVIVANSFKNNDLKSIADLYQKTAITQMILSFGIFMLILINFQNITFFLPEEYGGSFIIFCFLGIAQVIDSSMGINGFIMINSKYYRVETLSSVMLLFLTILSNYILIPIYGGNGAAMATLLSIFIYNAFRLTYISMKLKMQPYTPKTALAFIISLIACFVGLVIPKANNFILDALMRSSITFLIYIPLIYWSKLSYDINGMINQILKPIRKLF